MKKLLLLLNLLLALSLSFSVFAEEEAEEQLLTGQELFDRCNEGASPGNPSQFCMQYVFGYLQQIEMLMQMDPSQKRFICLDPQKVGPHEATEKVRNWLGGVPDRLGQEAQILVGEALAKNYPCETSGPSPF